MTGESATKGGAGAPSPASPRTGAQRTIRHANLFLTRVDPWSVMKNAFLLSVAVAIVTIVAVALLWGMLTLSGTVADLTRTVSQVAGNEADFDLGSILSFGRVMGLTLVVSAVEVVLLSALATLFAYLYNLSVGLTGGLQVTLTEDH